MHEGCINILTPVDRRSGPPWLLFLCQNLQMFFFKFVTLYTVTVWAHRRSFLKYCCTTLLYITTQLEAFLKQVREMMMYILVVCVVVKSTYQYRWTWTWRNGPWFLSLWEQRPYHGGGFVCPNVVGAVFPFSGLPRKIGSRGSITIYLNDSFNRGSVYPACGVTEALP